MNNYNNNSSQSPHSSLAPQPEMPYSLAPAGGSVPLAADRLYQFAALTVGLFLLFTLL